MPRIPFPFEFSYPSPMTLAVPNEDFDCQTCGACCSYSEDWPRFSLETDEELDRIPAEFISADLGGMRCADNRCSALSGKLGVHVGCTIYAVRPLVCRTCMPGDDECLTARQKLSQSVLL